MRRAALVVATGIAGLVPASATAAVPIAPWPLTPVRVSPRVGSPHTRFTVSLVLPSATGQRGLWSTSDALWVTGPRRSGCVASANALLPAGAAGQRVSVTIAPSLGGEGWCAGGYQGYVIESIRTICSSPPLMACPMIEVAPRVIARLRFRVMPAHPTRRHH